MKRHEEVYCPKCKARGSRFHDFEHPDDVVYKCKFCSHIWRQNTLLEFTDNTKESLDPNICVCGGRFEFSKINASTMTNIVKCNKCGFSKNE